MSNAIASSARKSVKFWWLSVLVGIVSIGLGIWFMAKPIEGLFALSIIFVAGFIATGISEMAFALSNQKSIKNWGWLFTNGIISFAIGCLMLGLDAPLIMVYFVGFWIMFQSIWGIGFALDMKNMNISGWGWLLALAVFGVIFALIFILSPLFGGSFIVMLASVSFILYGLFRLSLGIKMKSLEDLV